MPSKIYFRICLITFFCCLTVHAQENFTHRNGLPSNEVHDIHQDKNGFLWFATDRGLASYNGHEFKKFEPKHGLTDITIFDFFPQENGQIWCTTFNNKLFYFEDGTSEFRPYKYNAVIEQLIKKTKSAYFFINDLALDKKGNLHIATNGGFYIPIDPHGKLSVVEKRLSSKQQASEFGSKRKFILHKKINRKQGVSYLTASPTVFTLSKTDESVKRILSVDDNQKIVCTDKSAYILSRGKKMIQLSKPHHEPIECGLFDSDHFWISYRGKGVFIHDFTGKPTGRLLSGHSVTEIFRDSYGSLWLSTTDAGIFQFRKKKIDDSYLRQVNINSLTKDAAGNLYAGCYNGDIYTIGSSGTLSKIHGGLKNKPAFVQFNPLANTTYFSSDNIFFTRSTEEKKYYGILKISDDTDNLLLVRYGVYNVLTQGKEISADTLAFRIHDISQVGDKFYLASIKGLKISENGQLEEKTNPLLNYRIDDIDYEPRKKLFYMGSLGGGLIIYNPKNEKVYNIDQSKGLSNDLVTEVYIENENVIWACTNYGLNRIAFSSDGSYKVNYITAADGLSENQIRDVEIIGETIYAGTTHGLNRFTQQDFATMFSQKNYYLRLKEIAVNNLPRKNEQNELELRYDENQLDFSIEAVSFSSKNLVYRYKLKGLHEDWRQTGNRKIAYEFLPPGNYTLLVQVLEDNRHFSNETITLPIHIAQPFWKTWWFLLFLFLSMGALIYLFFRIRVLTYNQDIIRELLRLMVRKIRRKEKYFKFREQGKDIRIPTETILYVKSSGNYIDIITATKNYTVRCKIGDFLSRVPDPLEYLRIHRSYIIRIDKVGQKNRKAVFVQMQEIPVGETYATELDKIVF